MPSPVPVAAMSAEGACMLKLGMTAGLPDSSRQNTVGQAQATSRSNEGIEAVQNIPGRKSGYPNGLWRARPHGYRPFRAIAPSHETVFLLDGPPAAPVTASSRCG